MIYTEKQKELLSDFKQGKLKRINILSGSVRSGKTWISLVLWAFWIVTQPKDATYFMAAKTLTSLKRNCLDLLTTLVGEENFSYSISKKEGWLFGRKIVLEGASDGRSEGKIRGLTLAGAYVDELTLIPEDFVTMLLSRLSLENAKLFATTNPDSPHHYVRKRFLNREKELDLYVANFLIDDNTFLPRSYVAALKKEFSGVFYQRFIKGLWVAAEGVIYRQFADETEKFLVKTPPDISFATIGVDFGGNQSATAFVLTGFTPKLSKVVVLDEFYHKGTLSPQELEARFVDFVRRAKARFMVFDAFCDNAESTLIRGLENAALGAGLAINVRSAQKSKILDRIRLVSGLMSYGRFLVAEGAKHVISALCEAVWDEKSLTDVRKDDGSLNVDSLDDLEYSIEFYKNDLLDMR